MAANFACLKVVTDLTRVAKVTAFDCLVCGKLELVRLFAGSEDCRDGSWTVISGAEL